MIGYNYPNELRSPGAAINSPGASQQGGDPVTEPQYTPTTRVCSKCHIEKSLEAFARRRDGHRSLRPYCRVCNNKERWQRRQIPDRLELERERARLRGYRRDYSGRLSHGPRDPEHDRARAKLNDAIKAGKIIRPTVCSECGQGVKRIEAHHHDYSRPFDVEWLCSRCHGKRHRKPMAA